MTNWILLPPILFFSVLFVAWFKYKALAIFSTGEKWPDAPGKLKPYACGEDAYEHTKAQPDYGQFFPFAFFFTIMHVVALMVATVPSGMPATTLIAVIYLVASSIGLFILFRR